MQAILVLEDGTVFEGCSIGAEGETLGEVVFNTGMTGYQEVLTDPSYYGQIVCMTYPLIGNYGVNLDDLESEKPKVQGFISRNISDKPSNWRSTGTLNEYLKQNNIIGIQDIDTRELTKILREKGTMRGVITTNLNVILQDKINELRAYTFNDWLEGVTCKNICNYSATDKKELTVALLDFGVKKNIIRSLNVRNCDVTVFSAFESVDSIMKINPDGILLSNGPGDPKDCMHIIDTIKILVNSGIPIFGICLGHQLLALANGMNTEKLKYGHRGCNHPIKDTITGRTFITSQNHGYTVSEDSINGGVIKIKVTHRSMNDDTIEGIKYGDLPIFSVQFHPEASPGPGDTVYLFDQFVRLMKEHKGGANNAKAQ